MNSVLDYLSNHYIWFLVIALIIIFALIGYLVDITSNKKKKSTVKPIAPVRDTKVETHPSVEKYTNELFDEPLIDEKDA